MLLQTRSTARLAKVCKAPNRPRPAEALPVANARIQCMTAKELLLKEAPSWSEHDAQVALAAVEREREDPVIAAFHDAPEDDEPWTEQEDVAVREADEDIAAGRTVSHEEMLRKYA